MTINRDTLLRLVILTDFILVNMIFMADWLPKSYLFSQVTILMLGFWAIVNRGSVIQIELLLVIKFVSIILDSIAIGMYFEYGKWILSTQNHYSYFVLSAFCAILFLVMKPIMLLILNKVRQERLNDAAYEAYTPIAGYMSV